MNADFCKDDFEPRFQFSGRELNQVLIVALTHIRTVFDAGNPAKYDRPNVIFFYRVEGIQDLRRKS